MTALGGVCSEGVSALGGCLLWGVVSAPGGVCLGVSAPGGSAWGGVCSGGVSGPGGCLLLGVVGGVMITQS